MDPPGAGLVSAILRKDDQRIRELLKSGVCISSESGCWDWQGFVDPSGYAVLTRSLGSERRRDLRDRGEDATQRWMLHRVSYQAFHSVELHAKEPIHHRCANAKCINPAHLQRVTDYENNAEMMARRAFVSRIIELEDVVRSLSPTHPALEVMPLGTASERALYRLQLERVRGN